MGRKWHSKHVTCLCGELSGVRALSLKTTSQNLFPIGQVIQALPAVSPTLKDLQGISLVKKTLKCFLKFTWVHSTHPLPMLNCPTAGPSTLERKKSSSFLTLPSKSFQWPSIWQQTAKRFVSLSYLTRICSNREKFRTATLFGWIKISIIKWIKNTSRYCSKPIL